MKLLALAAAFFAAMVQLAFAQQSKPPFIPPTIDEQLYNDWLGYLRNCGGGNNSTGIYICQYASGLMNELLMLEQKAVHDKQLADIASAKAAEDAKKAAETKEPEPAPPADKPAEPESHAP